MNTRDPVVAGSFYPASGLRIQRLFDQILEREKYRIDYSFAAKNMIGCVVPHAGYVYSGYEAVHFFELLKRSEKQYETFLILNPNHSGYGEEVEADASDNWVTPFGKVEVDTEFVNHLNLPTGNTAQQQEHAAEVMLPFLQEFLNYPFRIVPVSLLHQTPAIAKELAKRIIQANRILKRRLMVIASSDFSHFEHPAVGKEKDDLVLQKVSQLDTQGVYKTVKDNHISVCGYGPIMTLIEYAKTVAGAPKTTILARGNSGKAHPSNSVVDYITVLFYSDEG